MTAPVHRPSVPSAVGENRRRIRILEAVRPPEGTFPPAYGYTSLTDFTLGPVLAEADGGPFRPIGPSAPDFGEYAVVVDGGDTGTPISPPAQSFVSGHAAYEYAGAPGDLAGATQFLASASWNTEFGACEVVSGKIGTGVITQWSAANVVSADEIYAPMFDFDVVVEDATLLFRLPSDGTYITDTNPVDWAPWPGVPVPYGDTIAWYWHFFTGDCE